jgi:acyl-CoA synthetase (NDP forming)
VTVCNLESRFAPRSVAVIGASNRERLLIVTNGSGPGVMATHDLVARGVHTIGDAPGQRCADTLAQLARYYGESSDERDRSHG